MADEHPNGEVRNSSSKISKPMSKRMERYHTDPEFRAKICAMSRDTYKKRIANDEQFRLNERERLEKLKERKLPDNPETVRRTRKRHKRKVKIEVYTELGNMCACCGEDNIEFLSVDHIKLDGNKHRAIIGKNP